MKQTNNKQSGFTLIEVVVVLGIIAIIASLAAISFTEWRSESTSRATLAKLRSLLVVTRMEAIKRGSSVMLCSSSTGTSCSGSFNDGWILFHDANANNELDADEPILVTEGNDFSNLLVTVTDPSGNELEQIAFNYRGFPSQNAVVTASKGDYSGNFSLSRLGRISAY